MIFRLFMKGKFLHFYSVDIMASALPWFCWEKTFSLERDSTFECAANSHTNRIHITQIRNEIFTAFDGRVHCKM